MPTSAVREGMNQAMQDERHGRFADACQKLERVISEAGAELLSLDARLRLGKLRIYLSQLPQADEVLRQAHDLALRAGATQKAVAALHLQALLLRRQFRHAEALRLLETSPVQHRAEAPTAETGQWLHYRGLLVADRGDLAQGERILFRAHALYKELHDDAGLAEVCDSLANLLLRHGKTRVALVFAEESVRLKRALGDRYGEAISLGTLGRVYQLQARYEEAARMFEADLAIARELGDVGGAGHMLNALGETALLRRDARAAMDYHRQSLAENPSPVNALHAQLGLAWARLETGDLEGTAAACDLLAALLAEHPDVHGLGASLRGLRGAVAWRRGDPQQGERLLKEAVDSLEAQKHATDTIRYLYGLRDLYQAQGDTAHAVQVMVRALNLLHECGAERGVSDLEHWLQTVDSPSLIRLALEQQLPEFVVKGILTGTLRRPPSRKQPVAVLFSDIRDYTRLTEGLGAEQVVDILNDWFTEATRVVRRHGGVVDKFIGDAIMAVFGVPEPREDAAADAVRAALDLREELYALNLRQQALGGRPIRVGVGIAAGEVVVGYIGSYLRQSFTVIGDAVNVASRLEAETKARGCDILVSGEVEEQQARSRAAETQYLGKIPVKGHEPVDVYQVKGTLQVAD